MSERFYADLSHAPWTPEQVENLNRRQAAEWLHPYTGPGHVNLVPSPEGWRLPSGELYQTWAHKVDAEGNFPGDLLAELRKEWKTFRAKEPGETAARSPLPDTERSGDAE